MRFVIRPVDGPFRYPNLGVRGRELSGYIPPGVEWRQINYGQGEGQIEIAGCEWGFYQTGCHGLAVALHIGEVPATEALDFTRRIAEMLCDGEPFEIVLQGTCED